MDSLTPPPTRRAGALPGARHAAKYSSPTSRVNWRLPLDLQAWLAERSAVTGNSVTDTVCQVIAAAMASQARAMPTLPTDTTKTD